MKTVIIAFFVFLMSAFVCAQNDTTDKSLGDKSLGEVVSTFNFVPDHSLTLEDIQEKFVVDTSHCAPVKIAIIGDQFKEKFLQKKHELVEVEEKKILGAYLQNSARCSAIMKELGGVQDNNWRPAETSLRQIYAMMLAQPNGEKGALMTNLEKNRANIFFLCDAGFYMNIVFLQWTKNGWYLSFGYCGWPSDLLAGHKVFWPAD